jgi:hypothetical protein
MQPNAVQPALYLLHPTEQLPDQRIGDLMGTTRQLQHRPLSLEEPIALPPKDAPYDDQQTIFPQELSTK